MSTGDRPKLTYQEKRSLEVVAEAEEKQGLATLGQYRTCNRCKENGKQVKRHGGIDNAWQCVYCGAYANPAHEAHAGPQPTFSDFPERQRNALSFLKWQHRGGKFSALGT